MKLDLKIGRSLKKASPTILTCIGAAGVVATAVGCQGNPESG